MADENSRKIFIDTQSRIRSMSAIYEKLNQSNSLESVQLDLYIKDLADSLSQTYFTEAGGAQIITRLAAVQLDIKRAVPLGLIVNELITNALKYAFPDERPGEIHVVLTNAGNSVELKVSDRGAGLPKGFDPNNVDSMGLKLVGILTKQIDGKLKIKSGKGTTVSVRFSL